MTLDLKNVDTIESGLDYMNRRKLNDLLTDFSYRTNVKIVNYVSNEVLFKSTVARYHQLELKQQGLEVEVAEVFDGQFIIKVL